MMPVRPDGFPAANTLPGLPLAAWNSGRRRQPAFAGLAPSEACSQTPITVSVIRSKALGSEPRASGLGWFQSG